MAFTVDFGQCSDAPEVLKKNPDFDIATTCTPWESVSDLTGKIIVEYNSAIEMRNYAHVYAKDATQNEGRERYCWIRDFEKVPGGQMALTLEVDPLMTYYNEIIKQDIEVTRCSKQANADSMSGYNSMLHDPEIETTVQRSYREFTFKLTAGDMKFVYPSDQYILAVIG